MKDTKLNIVKEYIKIEMIEIVCYLKEWLYDFMK